MKKKTVKLNNKSRQGEYVYIKEKNKQARYYKIPENTKKEEAYKAAEEHYTRRDEDKKKKTRTAKTTTINTSIKPGVTQTQIRNILTLNNTHKKEALKELMQNAKNQETKELLMQEMNQQKIKHRYEHTIEFKDKYGETLFIAKAYNKTINEIEATINKHIKTDQTYEADKTDYISNIKKKLEKEGIEVTDEIKSGNIHSATLKTTFRKLK